VGLAGLLSTMSFVAEGLATVFTCISLVSRLYAAINVVASVVVRVKRLYNS
jgi:hypothetical protein